MANGKRDRELMDFTAQDPWRVFRIMAEFVENFEELSTLGPAIRTLRIAAQNSRMEYASGKEGVRR